MGAYTLISINIYLYTYPFMHFSDSLSLEITMISSGIHKISPVFFGFPWPWPPSVKLLTGLVLLPGRGWPRPPFPAERGLYRWLGTAGGRDLRRRAAWRWQEAGDAHQKWRDLLTRDLPWFYLWKCWFQAIYLWKCWFQAIYLWKTLIAGICIPMKNAQLKGFNMNYQRKKCNSPKYKVQGGAPVHVFFWGWDFVH